MKIRIFQYFLCFASLISLENAHAQGIQFLHDEPIDKVLSLAKQQHKIVFIDGYTKACIPCKELDKKVFPLHEVGDYFNSNFINVKYDLEEPEGIKLHALYKDVITGYPSLILLDENGKMIHKMGGFHPADSLISKMSLALKGKSLSAMRARLQAGEKSISFVQEYKKILEDGYLQAESEEVSLKILDRLTDEEMLDPKMWQLVGRAVTNPYNPIFARVVKNYWDFWMKKSTDLGVLEFQMRSAIQRETEDIVKVEDKSEKLTLKSEPKKQALLLSYLGNGDLFKHTESIKAMFYIHDLALAGNWADLVTALEFYNKIGVFGNSTSSVYRYIQYMMQSCRDKRVLTSAAALLASLPKEKGDIMGFDDNYTTLIKLYELVGNKPAADKYKRLVN